MEIDISSAVPTRRFITRKKLPQRKGRDISLNIHARQYEFEIISVHSKVDGVLAVRHWDNVPEDWLYESGYINNFNKHRLERLKRYIDGKPILRDCGFDGMSLELIKGENVYCCIQAKYYSSKICGHDIGTTLIKYGSLKDTNPLSRLYIYGTSELQEDIREGFHPYNLKKMNQLFIHHPWCPPPSNKGGAYSENSYLHTPLRVASGAGDDFDDNPSKYESELELRPYQMKIIKDFSENDGIQIIQIPCGLGKTLITGHCLKKMNMSKVIAIAPLKVSVENLRRVCGFLPDYPVLVVDSDSGGTTDEEEITGFITSNDKYLILSTYESTENILSKIIADFDDTILVVDEAHNLLNNKCLLELINNTNDSILLSATIPEELYENFDEYTLHQYSWKEAILNGYCVDYCIWLPHLTKREDGSTFVDYTIPEELSIDIVEDSQELYAKGLFLINGMLKTGSRKCIPYMSSQEECDKFMKICEIISRKYHGIDIWTGKIDSNVRQEERKRIIQEFQQGEESTLYILTSVRILDEAVDIVRCDSEFISSVGEHSSDIRFTQRAFRGARLDSKNPYKKNNIFVWATGNETCLGIFEILRDEDPEFHMKIKHFTTDYDNQHLPEVQDEIKKEDKEFNEWFEAKCISFEEMRNIRFNQLKTHYEKTRKYPSPSSKYPEEMRVGKFLGKCRWYNKTGKLNLKLKKRFDEELPHALKYIYQKSNEQFDKLKTFIEAYGRNPRRLEWIELEEKRLGQFLSDCRKRNKIGKLPPELKKRFDEELPGALEIKTFQKRDPDSIFNRIKAHYEKTGKYPSSKSKDPEENRLYNFLQNCKTKNKTGTLSPELIKRFNEELPGALGIKKSRIRLKPNDKFNELKTFIEAYGRNPRSKNSGRLERIELEEKRLGKFLSDCRQGNKIGKLPPELKKQFDEELPGALEIKIFPDVDGNFNRIKTHYEKNGKYPSLASEDPEEKRLAAILRNCRHNNKKGVLNPEYKKRFDEELPGALDNINPLIPT